MRFATTQGAQTTLDPGFTVSDADLAPLGVEPVDGGHRLADMDEAGGEVEQFDIARVPRDEPQILIDHADSLVDVVQCRLQQFTVELNGLGRFVQHPHDVFRGAATAGQRR